MEEAAPQGSVQYFEAAAGSYVCIIDAAESPWAAKHYAAAAPCAEWSLPTEAGRERVLR